MRIEPSLSSVPLAKFYDYVLPEIPGFVTALVDQQLVQAARRFCRGTRCWRETLDPIDIVAGRNQYDLDAPQGAEVFEVARAEYNGQTLAPSSEEANNDSLSTWRTQSGVPSAYHLYEPGVIVLNRLPDTSINDGLVVEAWLCPSQDATALPGLLLSRYPDVIAKGAKSALMLMGKKPWTDRELGVAYAAEFTSAISSIAMRIAKGGARMPLRTKVVHGIKG